jgi:DNA-binding NarL/FixJ family response regulator
VNPIRILLVDDHAIVRAGFRALLGTLPDIAVVGEAANGYEALGLMRRHRPDIALVDVAMPGLNGLEVAVRARKASPKTHLIMLSMYDDEEYVRHAAAAGAVGFLMKQTTVAELQLALREVYEGRTYFNSGSGRRPARTYVPAEPFVPGPFELLTSRQREILQLIGEGHTAKAIALRLQLSIKTVDTHRAELMKRTRLSSMPELVRYAIRTGLARA